MPPTPEETTPAINKVWGSSNVGKRTFLTLPSGQTCWAVVLGLQGVLETGVLGEADSLTGFVGKEYVRKVRGAKGKPDGEELDAAKLMGNTDALHKILKMVDGLIPHIVVDPHVKCHWVKSETNPNDIVMLTEQERRPDQVYTDMVPLEDKMFLFNFAMTAVQDAETFRQESARAMGDVVDGEDVPGEAQHPDGSRSERRGKRRRPSRR